MAAASCTKQNYISITRTAGVNGAVVPAGMNTTQTGAATAPAVAYSTYDFLFTGGHLANQTVFRNYYAI